jgi:CheY-like chemotaxis protein
MPGRILVVDDSPTIRRLVRSVLEEAGYDVGTAADGQVALDLLQREGFDLVLIDFVMPRINGYQLAQSIRAIDRWRDLPLVLMSAKAESIGPRFVQQTRAANALCKPFEPLALLAVVEHVLNSGQRSQSNNRTLVSEELARGTSVPPPTTLAEPPRTSRRPTANPNAVTASAPTPSTLSATPRSETTQVQRREELDELSVDLFAEQAPQSREDPARTVFARPRTQTVQDSEPSWESAPPESENTVIGLLAPDFSDFGSIRYTESPVISQRFEAVKSFAQQLASQVLQVFPELRVTVSQLAEKLATHSSPEELIALADGARGAQEALSQLKAGLEGRIDLVPLGEVLQMLRFQQQTGVVSVKRGTAEVELCFHRGAIDLAQARDVSPEFLLGRYAVAEGVLTREQLDQFIASGFEGRLGAALVRARMMTAAQLEQILTRQSSEILYEVCRWRDGTFRFVHGVRSPEAEEAALGLPVEVLVLEGFRRVDEWGQIEQEVRSFEDVFALDHAVFESIGAARLSPSERRILQSVDGVRTVSDIIAHSAMNSFDACKTLFQLRRARVLRRKDR